MLTIISIGVPHMVIHMITLLRKSPVFLLLFLVPFHCIVMEDILLFYSCKVVDYQFKIVI